MYRNTYVEVNLSNLKYNVEQLIKKHSGYKYYIGVVKDECYGHGYIKPVKSIIDAGCNYLAVSTLEEALTIRKEIKDIPILCLGIISTKYLSKCIKNNITITISNIDYLNKINIKNGLLKAHLKINTGMNRLGVNNRSECTKMYNLIKEKNIYLEGIYTHIYNAENEIDTNRQFERFENITKDINLKEIQIVHLCASEATKNYDKKDYINGCRLGISMYGLIDYKDIDFKSTFSLYSEVIQINKVKDETVGYNGKYKVKDEELIAVVSIGYADGIIRKNTGRYVYINDKRYQIVGNICMDMLFVKVDDSVHVGDTVTIIKDIQHIKEIADYLETIPYEITCSINKKVPRIFI